MKDLIFVKEQSINNESQYKLINFLTKEEIERIAWSLDYGEIKIIEKKQEEEKIR